MWDGTDKAGIFPGHSTKGVLLSEKRLNSLLNEGLYSVTVSLDGLDNNYYGVREIIHLMKFLYLMTLVIDLRQRNHIGDLFNIDCK